MIQDRNDMQDLCSAHCQSLIHITDVLAPSSSYFAWLSAHMATTFMALTSGMHTDNSYLCSYHTVHIVHIEGLLSFQSSQIQLLLITSNHLKLVDVSKAKASLKGSFNKTVYRLLPPWSPLSQVYQRGLQRVSLLWSRIKLVQNNMAQGCLQQQKLNNTKGRFNKA